MAATGLEVAAMGRSYTNGRECCRRLPVQRGPIRIVAARLYRSPIPATIGGPRQEIFPCREAN